MTTPAASSSASPHFTMNVLARQDWEKSQACHVCGSHFSLFKRAHHCRHCGRAVCKQCSSKTVPILGEQQRVCDKCFDQLTNQIFHDAESQARKQAESSSSSSSSSSAADAKSMSLIPPPQKKKRVPLKLPIPANLSHLQSQPTLDDVLVSKVNDAGEQPPSPSFTSSASSSPISTSRTLSSSAPPSPVLTAASELPSIPSVNALLAAPTFTSFRDKLTAYHANISALEAEWRRVHEKAWRIQRVEVRDRYVHIASIVDSMKKALTDKSSNSGSSGAIHTVAEEERLQYFINLQHQYHEHLDQLDLDIHYPDPTERRYKLRVNAAEERITLAAEDVAIERVSGVFKAGITGTRMHIEITDVVAIMNIYHLGLSGKGTKVWGHFVQPERVALQLTIKRIYLPLLFKSSRLKQQQYSNEYEDTGRWSVDAAHAVFDIHVVKTIKGSASVPDSLIQWLIKTHIPRIILGVCDGLIPMEVGLLFKAHAANHVTVEGAFEVSCDFSNSVWESDLFGKTADAEAARHVINKPDSPHYIQPALFYTRMHLLQNIIVAAKLYKAHLPSSSLANWAKYIRQYSTCVEKKAQALWLSLLTEWQLALNALEASESLWFFRFIESVAAADDKPLSIHFALKEVSVALSLVKAAELFLSLMMKQVKKEMEESEKRNADKYKAIGPNISTASAAKRQQNRLQLNSKQHSLTVPGQAGKAAGASAPNTPLSPLSSASDLSPAPLAMVAAQNDAPAVTESLTELLSSPPENKSRPRAASTPSTTPRAAGDATAAASAAAADGTSKEEVPIAEQQAALDKVSPEQILKAGVEWKHMVETYLISALDILKALAITVIGQIKGGPAENEPAHVEDAQATISLTNLIMQLTMPPLKLTIGAIEFLTRSSTTTPAMKIVTRVNPRGFLEVLTMLTDPDTYRTHTYKFSFHAGLLSLFPTLMQHQQQQLFSSSVSALPAISLTLAEVSLEGPVKPALEYDKYLKTTEHTIIRAYTQEHEKQAEVKAQDEEQKAKESLLSLMNKRTGPDYLAILSPYLYSSVHQMKITVKLQISIGHKGDSPATAAASAALPTAAVPAVSSSSSAAAAYMNTAQTGSTVEPLTIPVDEPTNSTAGAAANSSVMSISLLAGNATQGFTVNTTDVPQKLSAYSDVLLSIHTPDTLAHSGSLREITSMQEQSMSPVAGIQTDTNTVLPQQHISIDVSFKATLFELITDIMQLALQ